MSITPKALPAETDNQVITLTGTNLSQGDITGVTVAGCVDADTDHIVVSPTTMYIVITSATCATATASSTVGETITLVSTRATTDPDFAGTGTTGLFFKTPPALAAARGVLVDNAAIRTVDADKLATAPINAATKIRVTGSGTTTWTTTGLSAKLNGVALTGIAIPALKEDGSSNTGPGNYFTATTSATNVATASGNVPLEVTFNGVTVSLTTAFAFAGQAIAVTPNSGPANGGTLLTVAGKFGTWTGATPPVTLEVNMVCAGTSTPVTVFETGTTNASLKFKTPQAIAGATLAPCRVNIDNNGGLTTALFEDSAATPGSTFTYTTS